MQDLEFLKVKTLKGGDYTIHCVQAPLDGEMVNAQIIEGEKGLLLLDTLQLKPHADELRTYIEGLGKPLDRVIITHYHPDHWFGAASFSDYPLYAFPEVISIINAQADFVLGYHRNLHQENPEVIPGEKVTPSLELEEGILNFDGLSLNVIKVLDTESPVNTIIELTGEKILLAQDLVYNGCYPYFGDRTSKGEYCFDQWISVLEDLQSKGFQVIIPGHGDPTGPAIFSTMIGYLKFVKSEINKGLKGEELISSIKRKYPDYELELTLQMSNYMLFVLPQETVAS